MNRTSAFVRGSAAFAAAMLAGSAFAIPTGPEFRLDYSGAVKVADTFVVNVNIAGMTASAVGAQAKIDFDSSKVDLISIGAGTNFPVLIYQAQTSSSATFATGILAGSGATGVTSGNVAKLTFKMKGTQTHLCTDGIGAAFASFNNRITDSSGNPLNFSTVTSVSATVLGAFAIQNVPANVSGQACDAGSLDAVVALVSGAAPSAADSCSNSLQVALSVMLPGASSATTTMPSAFPIGTTTLTWSASDAAGNSDSKSATVQVDDRQVMTVSASLSGNSLGASTRAMNFAYGSGSQPVNITMAVSSSGVASGSADIDIMPARTSAPACSSLKDVLHSLRALGSSWATSGSGTKWTSSFSLTQGDSNNDNLVDILDFGMYVGDSAGSAATDARSNFNGDGAVDNGDFTFISANFFAPGASCTSAWQGSPLASVSLKQLRRMGMGDLAVADINRDGRIDQADIVAFMQGQRGGEATRNTGSGASSSAE